jgi:hypothetical protein
MKRLLPQRRGRSQPKIRSLPREPFHES